VVIDNGVAIAITIENLKKTKQNKTTTISKQNEVFVFKFSLFCSCLVGWLVGSVYFVSNLLWTHWAAPRDSATF